MNRNPDLRIPVARPLARGCPNCGNRMYCGKPGRCPYGVEYPEPPIERVPDTERGSER